MSRLVLVMLFIASSAAAFTPLRTPVRTPARARAPRFSRAVVCSSEDESVSDAKPPAISCTPVVAAGLAFLSSAPAEAANVPNAVPSAFAAYGHYLGASRTPHHM